MIGKNIVENRPVTLVEVADIMEKRLKDAEEEMKRRKKEEKKMPLPPPEPEPEPAPAAEGEEGAEAPAPAEEKPEKPEDKSPLGMEQRAALEYAKKFSKVGKRNAKELYDKLNGLDKMKPEVAAKVVDILPTNEEQVKLLFAKERVNADSKDVSAVVKLVEEYKK